jgi:hypothetical protein
MQLIDNLSIFARLVVEVCLQHLALLFVFPEVLLGFNKVECLFLLLGLNQHFKEKLDKLHVDVERRLLHLFQHQQVSDFKDLGLKFERHRNQVPDSTDHSACALLESFGLVPRLILLLQQFRLTHVREE